MSFEIPREYMTAEQFAKVRTHILRQRQKKKQEQEADAAVEKLRREQELKREQSKLTLEEIEEQLATAHERLRGLKKLKQDLFCQLKEILNDEEKKKSEEAKEALEKEMARMHRQPYPNQNVPPATHSMYMIGGNRVLHPNPLMYKVPAPAPTSSMQPGAVKRQRSPSPPPPQANYQQGFNYKPHVMAYPQGYSIHHPIGQYPQEQGKPIPGNYHVQVPHLRAGFVQQPPAMKGEGFYIQQTGGITSGYPIRSQPQVPPHFQGAPSHAVRPPMQVAMRKEDFIARTMDNNISR